MFCIAGVAMKAKSGNAGVVDVNWPPRRRDGGPRFGARDSPGILRFRRRRRLMHMFRNEGNLMGKIDEAAPFSQWLGWSVLRPFKSSVQLVPFKSSVNLINDSAPFSGWFKWDVLQPFESNVVLHDDPTPLSNKLGISVLQDSEPFSTLSPDRT
jgi:hypothetical protein